MTVSRPAEERLQGLCALPLEELRERFWKSARDVVRPLADLAAGHTTPSIERSVLMRMGFDSLEAKALVDHAVEQGWLGDGVGGVLARYAADRRLPLREAYRHLLKVPEGDMPSSGVPLGKPPTELRLEQHMPFPVREILSGLEGYRPRRRGWVWRQSAAADASFTYRQTSRPLTRSGALQAASYMQELDPQPDCTVTSEIASGRFEDDLRRMRMAAWHGADHIMVIRTLGQSHYDGLVEGTPEGVGGVPISRKQLRATRRALDLVEDEVGRPINLHSYVSGIAGSEMAVLFAEEGVAGAHQDFQYNILYRGVNPVRSVVDAFEAKRVLADAGILQLDGAHNANSTALKAWNVRPEILVQHALNCVASELAGQRRELIALSTVPPTAPPAPKVSLDLPFAVALRYLFEGFAIRAQQNTRYSTTNLTESTVLHVLDTVISRLTSADIQSTIAADEARCIPWHHTSTQAVSATKQALIGLDGLSDLVKPDTEAMMPAMKDLMARAVLMLDDILAVGGYFAALEAGLFVDSAAYPRREGDGIVRNRDGGVAADTVVPRSDRYWAPVCSHYGHTVNMPACPGCTLCDDSLVRYVDELDPEDNVHHRLAALEDQSELIRPEGEHAGDGLVTVSFFVPLPETVADAAALRMAEEMRLAEPRIVDRLVLHPAEGVQYDIVGRFAVSLRRAELPTTRAGEHVENPPEHIRAELSPLNLRVVGATLGNDEHSVGLQEITNIKHHGLEWFGLRCRNIGSSVLAERLLDEAVEQNAQVVLASLIVSHRDVHRLMMTKLADAAVERGVRHRLVLIAGGPQVTDELALACGLDAGFGPGTRGIDVARFLAGRLAGQPTP
ncbi:MULTISPECIES: D-ornithine 4,5-aminomutase subunit OraE [unclassified Streptomyces]|uniref:D-ornithine 4,5-aminomutase subunit OraE n=1 Tax=unclassified Streptomyces TaxID=2593676 RepID=UPI00336A69E7